MARPKHVELQWGDLTPLIVDKKVTLQLPEDVTVKGRVLSVRDDGLYMNIKKRSKKKAYPKGPTVIPRADVSLIEVRQKHGVKYRAILTSGGAVVGAGLIIAAMIAAGGGDDGGNPWGVVALFAAAGGGLGYGIGDGADTKVMRIKIVDDPPQVERAITSPSRE